MGRVIRPHGIRGELTVEVRSDDPAARFAVGAVLGTDPASAGPLTVQSTRWHSGNLLVRFAEILDRTDADGLRGVWLTVDADSIEAPQDPDEFHDQQLVGLTVATTTGEVVGVVADVLHHGQDLLVVGPAPGAAASRGAPVLVPFVAAIVVEVDLPGGRCVIDPPPGLLELAAPQAGGGGREAGGDARER